MYVYMNKPVTSMSMSKSLLWVCMNSTPLYRSTTFVDHPLPTMQLQFINQITTHCFDWVKVIAQLKNGRYMNSFFQGYTHPWLFIFIFVIRIWCYPNNHSKICHLCITRSSWRNFSLWQTWSIVKLDTRNYYNIVQFSISLTAIDRPWTCDISLSQIWYW